MRGVFIVIEGPEGAGKTTLAAGLARRLQEIGVDPVSVREPGGTPVAEAARRVFLDPALDTGPESELFLVLAARADLVARVIRPALEAGRVVVSERYDFSTEAYQVVGRGLDAEAVAEANGLATGGLRPDLTLVLDLSAELGRERQERAGKSPDRLEQADLGMHERVVKWFAALEGPGVVHLDATRPAADVEARAWEEVQRIVEETIGVRQGLN